MTSCFVLSQGLAGDLPPGLAGRLPKLREVKLDGNLLEGNVLELLMYSRTMTSFSASRNRLTGRVPCPGAGRVDDEDEALKRGVYLILVWTIRVTACFCFLQMRIK